MTGIAPGTALLLSNANTTKPLQRCYGLVVLANALVVLALANKSAVPVSIPIMGSNLCANHDLSKLRM
jgi:hypothetical protein